MPIDFDDNMEFEIMTYKGSTAPNRWHFLEDPGALSKPGCERYHRLLDSNVQSKYLP